MKFSVYDEIFNISMNKIIDKQAVKTRKEWVNKIANLNGDFSSNFNIIEKSLKYEIDNFGIKVILDHLRLCGNIPESYGHDTSQEKLYSKYTDILLSLAYRQIGLRSVVISERADFADVEAFADKYSFVADAKAFRLSRTAKNQKDFKVQAMDRWKHGKPYAMIVCPIYQLPRNTSQIYHQAITRDVCIFSYSHLALLIKYSEIFGQEKAQLLLFEIYQSISSLNPSKNAFEYWQTINKTMLNKSKEIEDLWKIEKLASMESIEIAKLEGLKFLACEREKIMNMTHQEALNELIKINKIDNKIRVIKNVSDNGLFAIS
jgi:type II restriction enzyme